jgi:hypothetical protein
VGLCLSTNCDLQHPYLQLLLIKRGNSEKNDLNDKNSQKNEEMEGKKGGISWISSK